jgi:hypothetical protein
VKAERFAIASPHEFFVRAMTGSLMKAAEDEIVARGEVEEWLEEHCAYLIGTRAGHGRSERDSSLRSE